MILITGGTGFIGAYIIKNLIEKGFAVRALRRSDKTPFFLPASIVDRVEWVQGDVLDTVSIYDAMEGVEGVIHAAAIVSFAKGNRHAMYQINIDGTANVINAAIDHQVQRLVHVSSVAALGRTSKPELVSEQKKWEETKHNTHYAITKHRAELEVWRGFAEGLEGVIINPSTVLGFGDWHQSSCAIFKNAYKEFAWYTKGMNGFVGVEDVAEASAQLLLSPITQKRFVVNAENISFQHLFTMIAEGFGRRPPYREATKMMGEIAWRMEALKALITRQNPLLTQETARVAQSKTQFDNAALLKALPGFAYTPLETVINKACKKYIAAVQSGQLAL